MRGPSLVPMVQSRAQEERRSASPSFPAHSANAGDRLKRPARRGPVSRDRRRGRARVEGNARLTGATAVALLVLFAIEGATLLDIRSLVVPHVVVGMLIIPPVLVKTASTTWKMVRYYRWDPPYRRHGPPAPLLRLLGPFMVMLTWLVLLTGVASVLVPVSWQLQVLFFHKASFVLWFAVTAIHVLGHIGDTKRLAPRDYLRRTRREVAGAGKRQWVLASSLALGLVMGIVMIGRAHWFLAHSPIYHSAIYHG